MLQAYGKNPWYWEWEGEPLLLLGASDEDNLFQIPDLSKHLEELAACGGNYVRCTMSSRDPGDQWPFQGDLPGGGYDLERWNGEYWRRFEFLISRTAELGIFVQIELWDRFDFAREPWGKNPFNPKNNSNYSPEESGLVEEIRSHPGARENAFFRTIPELEDNRLVLEFQKRFIDKLLSISLEYQHILYCMDNETNEDEAWGGYWSRYIKKKADEAGRRIHRTEMWDPHDLGDKMHSRTWGQPELYSFIDISQGNHQYGRNHWDRLLAVKEKIAEAGFRRPLNMVKIYGAKSGHFGTTRDAVERFWRNALAGIGAFRFHRPPAGLGLNDLAKANIRSMRLVTERIKLWEGEPDLTILEGRSWNEVYSSKSITGNPQPWIALFFPDGGRVSVLLENLNAEERVRVTWLDILKSRWRKSETYDCRDKRCTIETPADFGFLFCLIQEEPR